MGVLVGMPPNVSARPSAPSSSMSPTRDLVKIPPVLVVLVLSAVKLLMSPLFVVSTRMGGCCALEPVKLLSGTLRRLLNVWLMNSSILPRDHLTRMQSRRRMNLNVSLNPTDNLYWLFCLGCCQIHPI